MLGRIRVNSRDPAKKLDAFSVNMSYAFVGDGEGDNNSFWGQHLCNDKTKD